MSLPQAAPAHRLFFLAPGVAARQNVGLFPILDQI